MAVIRVKHFANYTVISNTIIDNPNLSMEAKAILIYLLSKPQDWDVRAADVERWGNCGKKLRRRVYGELEREGYLKVEKYNDLDGTLSYDYIVTDTQWVFSVPPEAP